MGLGRRGERENVCQMRLGIRSEWKERERVRERESGSKGGRVRSMNKE